LAWLDLAVQAHLMGKAFASDGTRRGLLGEGGPHVLPQAQAVRLGWHHSQADRAGHRLAAEGLAVIALTALHAELADQRPGQQDKGDGLRTLPPRQHAGHPTNRPVHGNHPTHAACGSGDEGTPV
jgi:hypothetical protein